jgi:hypothetical protein
VNFELNQSTVVATSSMDGPDRLEDWVLAVPPNLVPAKILHPRTQAKQFFVSTGETVVHTGQAVL